MRIRLTRSDVAVGKSLSWPVYDEHGNLLLRQGYIVASEKQLERLLKGGLFRTPDKDPPLVEDPGVAHQQTPFSRLEDVVIRLGKLLDLAYHRPLNFRERLEKLVDELIEVCNEHADAALGFVHQFRNAPYTHYHPLKIAILSVLVARAMELEAEKYRSLAAACLTCNVSMVELQNVLQVQTDPITDDQKAEISAHPKRSIRLLSALGVNDSQWLNIVFRHHERPDGSGYPEGVQGAQIPLGARILAVGDRYAASTAPRGYKRSLAPIQALQEAFKGQQDGQYDSEVIGVFIRTIGVYPPGSTVRLANGERAIVIRRNLDKSTEPLVAAVENPQGNPLAFAMRRDTSEPAFKITQPAPLTGPLRLPLAYLWGYIDHPSS